MKRFIKMLAVTSVAALALTAMAAAGASAATFTASATGEVTGVQTSNQVFTVGGGSYVTCKKAHTKGSIEKTEDTQKHVTVTHSECTYTIFGTGNYTATVSTMTTQYTANGTVHVKNTTTITVVSLGCKTTVEPQTRESVSYSNKSGKLEVTSNVTGIVSKGEGFCPGGTSGTYSGSSLLERVGGGTISWDA